MALGSSQLSFLPVNTLQVVHRESRRNQRILPGPGNISIRNGILIPPDANSDEVLMEVPFAARVEQL